LSDHATITPPTPSETIAGSIWFAVTPYTRMPLVAHRAAPLESMRCA